jgi:SAM-dependent methyltransferase
VTDGSVIFDRAASYYDQTRNLPPETASEQTTLLVSEIGQAAGPVLEIGVGTGRIAVPLAEAGLRVIGVDLSGPMLAELARKDSPVIGVRASATALPLRSAAVSAVIASHVLHLIPGWQRAVTEALRVLRPGGVLLATRGGEGTGLGAELRRRFRAAAGMRRAAVGLHRLDGLDEFLRARGIIARHLPPIPVPGHRTVAELLRNIEDNVHSWTWPIPDDRRLAAAAEVRAWFADTVGDPELTAVPSSPVRWRSYRIW